MKGETKLVELDSLLKNKLEKCFTKTEHPAVLERAKLVVLDYAVELAVIGTAIRNGGAGDKWRAPLAVGLVYAAWNSVKGLRISYRDCADKLKICGWSTLKSYNKQMDELKVLIDDACAAAAAEVASNSRALLDVVSHLEKYHKKLPVTDKNYYVYVLVDPVLFQTLKINAVFYVGKGVRLRKNHHDNDEQATAKVSRLKTLTEQGHGYYAVVVAKGLDEEVAYYIEGILMRFMSSEIKSVQHGDKYIEGEPFLTNIKNGKVYSGDNENAFSSIIADEVTEACLKQCVPINLSAHE